MREKEINKIHGEKRESELKESEREASGAAVGKDGEHEKMFVIIWVIRVMI